MSTLRQPITTRELADRRGVTRQAIAQAVKRGSLTPAIVLDNGYFLFEGDDVEGGDK